MTLSPFSPGSGKLVQHLREIRFFPEYIRHWIGSEPIQALDRVANRKQFWIERIVNFFPEKRHRHRRAGQWSDAERRDDRLAVTILQIVDIDLVAALGDVPRNRSDVLALQKHHTRQQLAEHSRLLVGALTTERQHDVQPGLASRLDVVGKAD